MPSWGPEGTPELLFFLVTQAEATPRKASQQEQKLGQAVVGSQVNTSPVAALRPSWVDSFALTCSLTHVCRRV